MGTKTYTSLFQLTLLKSTKRCVEDIGTEKDSSVVNVNQDMLHLYSLMNYCGRLSPCCG